MVKAILFEFSHFFIEKKKALAIVGEGNIQGNMVNIGCFDNVPMSRLILIIMKLN